MNNKIKLAVAGAVMSAASVANAGIVIPAGDWTLDVNGNVNAFANFSNYDSKADQTITGALAGREDVDGEDNVSGINTGLLPAWLGFTGTTRQNDVDVSFTISFQPNVSDNGQRATERPRGREGRKSRAADREPRSRLGAETPTRSDHSLGSGRLAETPLVRRRLVRTSHKEGSGRVTGSSHLGDLVGRQAHAAECVAGSRGAPRGEGSCGPGRKPC
jgi:hypothetical protein